jgi:hypothetical protein
LLTAKSRRNAADLITEYWRKHSKNRKSLDNKPKSRRKSTAREASPEAAPKKRARTKPKEEVVSDSEEAPANKKPKKSNGTTKASPKADVADENEDREVDIGGMDKYRTVPSWDHLISAIDTVERNEQGDLYVYFTLLVLFCHIFTPITMTDRLFQEKRPGACQGNFVGLCRKVPQEGMYSRRNFMRNLDFLKTRSGPQLIEFYESNLKWRTEDDASQDGN